MRIFIAGLGTEINSFSPIPSGMPLFEEVGIFRGDGSLRWRESGAENYVGPILEVWRKRLQEDGVELVEGLCACAQPAGTVPTAVYEELRDMLLDDVRQAGNVDIILLCLHGAMVAGDYEDCEGDILAKIRQIVGGDVVIGVHLDLHVNMTNAMLENADILISHKEYPHIDGPERAHEIYELVLRSARGEIKPVARCFDTHVVGLFPTTREPMSSFVAELSAAESGGVLSLSLGHGFPYSDIASTTAKVWVTTDNDEELAAQAAEKLGIAFYRLREKLRPPMRAIDDALDDLARYVASGSDSGPLVIADAADNAGGGAANDSTFILQRVLERGIGDIAIGCFWDPVAVQQCFNGGEGAEMDLRIGGKCGPGSGQPIDLRIKVRSLVAEHSQIAYDNAINPLGPSVWLEADNNVHVVLISTRTQTYSPEAFTSLGLDLSRLSAVVVKSTQHFYEKFATVAGDVCYAATPGAMRADFANIPYSNNAGGFWPLVEDPLHLDEH